MWVGCALFVWCLVGWAALGVVFARRRLRLLPVAASPGPVELPLYGLAFLCGGRRRVAQAALAVLWRAGLIGVENDRIVLTGTAATATETYDPVEQAALAACRPGRSVRPRRVEKRTKRSVAVRRIGDALARRGLIVHPARRARVETWLSTLILLAEGAAFFAMAALVVWESGHNDQAGMASAVAAGAVLPAVLTLARSGAQPLPTGPTDEGRRVISEQATPAGGTSDHQGPQTLSALRRAAALRAVAIHGPSSPGMPLDLARVLRRAEPSTWRPDDPAGLGGL
ncbi:TIGR04222 domain-containing membrane protein [Streptomyces sp. NPDC005898]|uniref:TIGR04222 domain-containing membrane protein n=1 Tax=Streptomyces sp. NPDC005898 TaxID=3157082 RepID=UPI0033C45A7A